MKKIIKEYRFNGDTYTLKCEKNGVKYFEDTDGSYALITDKDDNILFKTNAGFLKLKNQNK